MVYLIQSCLQVLFILCAMSMANQSALSQTIDWKIELSRDWNVLGPFPIHAREQHYLSPAFPLNLSEPIDWNKSWPSSYADRGEVSWSTAQSDANGILRVTFPDIRWQTLRATEGWAALQHHAVLRTTLTVYPPPLANAPMPRLFISLTQGSYFTIVSSDRGHVIPEWYAGNIYNMERALPRPVQLPLPPYPNRPTVYHVFVSGDYEIRLFGDPTVQGSQTPVQTIGLSAELETLKETLVHEPSHDVICDFIDGTAFGDAFGIALRSTSESTWWTVDDVITPKTQGLRLTLKRKTVIAPTQLRVVPLALSQSEGFLLHELQITLNAVSKEGETRIVSFKVPINQQRFWSPSTFVPVKATYLYARSMPTAFIAVPPVSRSASKHPPILALHGAGVDIFGPDAQFWIQSIPRNNNSWLVFPSGRTSWGLDWHGPSANDAWCSVDALHMILESDDKWREWGFASNLPVILMGHSNGGQGAWYMASRYPDRVAGVIPAAAFIKSQAYIPLTMSRSAHYIDPSMRAILETSLTPDDNDLHVGNLANTPILVIHGGNDTNVPVWHSRELAGILKTLGAKNVTLKEDPGQDHWYPTVFDNDQVQQFMGSLVMDMARPAVPQKFTLTVSDPNASGSLFGVKVDSLSIPGRLGRLHVDRRSPGFVKITTTNVGSFTINCGVFPCHSVQVEDSQPLSVRGQDFVRFAASGRTSSTFHPLSQASVLPAPSRIQNFLTSPDSITFIIADDIKSRELSVALRLAHDLYNYHRLDAELMVESKALALWKSDMLPTGNLVYVGNASSTFPRELLAMRRTAFGVKDGVLELNGRAFSNHDAATAFIHPHPSGSADSNMLFLLANEHSSFERITRLFPIRTGIPVPSWVITSSLTDQIGAAGVLAAGVWSNQWNLNPILSIELN